MIPLCIIVLFPVKEVVSSESGEKYAQIKYHLQAKTALNKYFSGVWYEKTTGHGLFSQEEALLWIIDSNFVQKQQFKFKTPLWWICFLQIYSFSLHKSLNSWIGVMCITCGLLQKLYQLFGLSFWWHLTAEDSLVSKSYNTKFLKISSDEETNWRRIHLSAFSFCFFVGEEFL